MPKFPFTNYHELNLDWILKKVEALFTASEENARTIRTYDNRLTYAELTATNAGNTATSAQQLANAAAANADNALSVAGTADAKADSALIASTDASSAVSGALTAAQEAQQTAGAAVAKANDAAATAASLESLANTANQNATAALETAQTADQKAVAAQTAAATADQKAVAAQTAATTNAGNITTLQTDISNLNRQISELTDDVDALNTQLKASDITNILYGNSDITENIEWNVSVTGAIPTAAYLGRYNGGFNVTAGTYIFGANISVGDSNTATSGYFSVAARRYNTTSIISTVEPSSTPWAYVIDGTTRNVIFKVTFAEDANIYLMLFGTSHTVGTVWNGIINNVFMYKVEDDLPINTVNNYFLTNFSESYTTLKTIDNIDERITALETCGATNTVICWGDSITHGAGGDGVTYPNVLASLATDFSVLDYGVGGENAQTIAGRSGAIPFVLFPCTLTRNRTPVNVTIKSLNGADVQPVRQRVYEYRDFIIQNVEFILAYDANTGSYTLTSRYDGEGIINITEPTIIINVDSAHSIIDGSVACICIGTNGWGSTDALVLARIINTMIAYSKSKRYIVIGMPTHYNASSVEDQKESDRILGDVFGQNFVNLYSYLVGEWALDAAGITPTTQDQTDITEGRVPSSLRSDGTHLNQYGYTLMGQQVYKAGQRLGYWN